MTGPHLPQSDGPEDWDRERLIRTVQTQREMLNDRPDRSSAIYVSVYNGRARVLLPNGGMEIVTEGNGLHIWPGIYLTRVEKDAA